MKRSAIAAAVLALAALPYLMAAVAVNSAGGGAPTDATYITKTADSTLSGEFAMGSLATGIVKNTTTTGTPSIAAAGTDYVAPGGALGTPSTGTLTNCTGLPVATGISGLGAGVATTLATPSSANMAAECTDETGSGSLVFGTGPTITAAPTLTASSGGSLGFASRTLFAAPSDGVLTLTNNAANDFTRLQFGGTSSSFPAIKRVTSSLQCRLADDSGFCNFQTASLTVNAGLTQNASGSTTSIASSTVTFGNLPTADPSGSTRIWNNGGVMVFGDFDGATARTALGLGSIATQAASNVSITGGSVTGITDLAVADGGTGASTAAGARTNLEVAPLSVSTTQVGNIGTSETDLATYTVAAGKLATNGDSLWFEASGSFAANGNTKTLRVRWGNGSNTQVFSTGSTTSNNLQWTIRGRIIRTGAATQKGYAIFVNSGGGASGSLGQSVTNLDSTLSSTGIIKVTGQSGTGSNDILLETFTVGVQ